MKIEIEEYAQPYSPPQKPPTREEWIQRIEQYRSLSPSKPLDETSWWKMYDESVTWYQNYPPPKVARRYTIELSPNEPQTTVTMPLLENSFYTLTLTDDKCVNTTRTPALGAYLDQENLRKRYPDASPEDLEKNAEATRSLQEVLRRTSQAILAPMDGIYAQMEINLSSESIGNIYQAAGSIRVLPDDKRKEDLVTPPIPTQPITV